MRTVLAGDTPFPVSKTHMNEQSCGRVDLSPGLGPVHNQTAATCYAYTAVDLMNYGLQKRYSPMYLAALKPYQPPGPTCPGEEAAKPTVFSGVGGYSGGWIDQAIVAGMQNGLCPESIIPSTEKILNWDYERLLQYYLEYNASKQCPPPGVAVVPHELPQIQMQLKRLYPNLQTSFVKSVADKTKTPDEFMKTLNSASCGAFLERNVPPGKTPANVHSSLNIYFKDCRQYYYEEDRARLLKMINQSLDKGKPAGISYITGGLIQDPNPTTHAFHASVVAGRGWVNGSCMYLIKNSWGADWKVKAGLKALNSADHPGYFVVSEKQLMEHLFGTTTID